MIRSTKGFKKCWEVELQTEKQILRNKKKRIKKGKGEKNESFSKVL